MFSTVAKTAAFAPLCVQSRGMATLKDIRMRLKSVKNIQKITQSMKMVSAAKYARAERELKKARPFGEGAQSFYESAQVKGDDSKPGTLIIALTSDRGLCGAVHTNVAKKIRTMLGEVADNSDMKVVCIGDKSRAMLQRVFGKSILCVFSDFGKKPPTFDDATTVADYVINCGFTFERGLIIYNRFKSVVSYTTTEIPVFSAEAIANADRISTYDSLDADVIKCYQEYSLASMIYYAMKENACSEQSSRMTAMDSASKNAGVRHTSLLKANCQAACAMTEFCQSKEISSLSTEKSSVLKATNNSSLMSTCATNKDVLDAEILWCLKCISSHYSYKSCNGIGELFQAMFPDSIIANEISGSERKYAYLCHFGLAPYFQRELSKQFSEVKHYTLLFDETLNKTIQQKQLDIHVRFWHTIENCVKTQYLTSAFMGHSKAEDILKVFYECVDKLDLSKLLQISMDGPAVNWKFYDTLQSDLKKEYDIECVNIGSCGLHIINNAFKKGAEATEWDISSILSALYHIFKDCPARREDFLNSSELKQLPVKFCNYRWLESAPASSRAFDIWKDVVNFIKLVELGKLPKITSKSFCVLATAAKDKLMPAKLVFFTTVSEVVKPFLLLYQSDKPLLPFFGSDILTLVKHCLTLFNVIEKESAEKLTTSLMTLSAFDFDDTAHYSAVDKVSAGFRTDKMLKDMLQKKEITDKCVIDFKRDCQRFIAKMLSHLMLKCPTNYVLVRNLKILDPKYMSSQPQNCCIKMKRILQYLVQKKRISDTDCDKIVLELTDFLDNVVKPASEEFKNFDANTMQLDAFLTNYMNSEEYQKLWELTKMLLILSHGQASVERGFSINKKIENYNLKPDSYIAQRVVYEYVKFAGDVSKIKINKEMRIAAASARSKYHAYLQEQRLVEQETEFAKKRKLLNEELTELNSKKRRLEKEVQESEELANNLAEQAEAQSDFSLLKQSNDLRKSIKEKTEDINKINVQISEKKQK